MSDRNTILLVDDSPRIRPLVRAILSELRCHIIEASNAEQALEAAEYLPGPLDLLLTDITMPGMNGPDLAVQLRRRYPDLRVLYMSGYALPSATGKGIEFIEKPFRPDALLNKVRGMLSAG